MTSLHINYITSRGIPFINNSKPLQTSTLGLKNASIVITVNKD